MPAIKMDSFDAMLVATRNEFLKSQPWIMGTRIFRNIFLDKDLFIFLPFGSAFLFFAGKFAATRIASGLVHETQTRNWLKDFLKSWLQYLMGSHPAKNN